MTREDLRRVVYALRAEDGFNPDATKEELRQEEEDCRQRDGYFHCWIPVEEMSPQSGNFVTVYKGLVEDADTGNLVKIDTELITFKG